MYWKDHDNSFFSLKMCDLFHMCCHQDRQCAILEVTCQWGTSPEIKLRISVKIQWVENISRDLVAIQELQSDWLHQDPWGGMISHLHLSIPTVCLNSRIRSRGLSAREMLVQRHQYTNMPIPVTDCQLILDQLADSIKTSPIQWEIKDFTQKTTWDTTLGAWDQSFQEWCLSSKWSSCFF